MQQRQYRQGQHARRCRRVLGPLLALGLAAAGLTGLAVGAGAPAAAARPVHVKSFGRLESLRQRGHGFHVHGWAINPNVKHPAAVYVNVDGKRIATLSAHLPRPRIARSHPGAGRHLGFDAQLIEAAGRHRICVRVADTSGIPVTLRCESIYLDHDPIGAITKLTQRPGTLTVTGWVIDRDTPKLPRTATVRLDGRRVTSALADQPVPGLDATHHAAGDDHGFSVTIPITEGSHQICVRGQNGGEGFDKVVACAQKTIDFSPSGAVSVVQQTPGGVRVRGYAVDPDEPGQPVPITITANGTTLGTTLADGPGSAKPGHGFTVALPFGGTKLVAGTRTICAVATNLGRFGKNAGVGCRSPRFDWNPSVGLESATQKSPGVLVRGWAADPDTSGPIRVAISADGTRLATLTAGGAGGSHPGHMFSAVVPLDDGSHRVCARGINVDFGSTNGPWQCRTVKLDFDPFGNFGAATRVAGSDNIRVMGWTIDPDTTAPIDVQVLVNGTLTTTAPADVPRPDIAKSHPGTGPAHGFSISVPAAAGEQRVCVNAVNTLGGATPTVSLGCKIVDAVDPKVPSAPSGVTAVAGYGGANVSWQAPASDGGAPWDSFTVRTLPSGPSLTVKPGMRLTTVYGLKPNTKYHFSVVAHNVAGTSAAGQSSTVTTLKQPPPQTTPAPVSTSRYIRNITGSSTANQNTMRNEGADDARANPSGHGYLIMLAVGGQDQADGGVILTAGIRFVSYAAMRTDIERYVDGYAGAQKPSAPVTIAITTNNDLDVYRASGVGFVNQLINPLRTYAARYPGITIAGSDDMEPGFHATFAQTSAWLNGYLATTRAPFVFTGSADGCPSSHAVGACNNGWTMQGLYHLAGGARPIQMINVPQIYNTTMAGQWRYISLTGVDHGGQKINFGGVLTEWTACHQAGTCGSLTGNTAWTTMWNQLRADTKLRPNSLPYSTDLRIDR